MHCRSDVETIIPIADLRVDDKRPKLVEKFTKYDSKLAQGDKIFLCIKTSSVVYPIGRCDSNWAESYEYRMN